jgi:hypothetical protein
MEMKDHITVGIIGAGARGAGFGRLIRDATGMGRVVAVAEPRDAHRKGFAETHPSPGRSILPFSHFDAPLYRSRMARIISFRASRLMICFFIFASSPKSVGDFWLR